MHEDTGRGLDTYYHRDDGVIVTRKEADVLHFPRFGTVVSFRQDWAETCREIINKSGRRAACNEWWSEVEKIKEVTFEELGYAGSVSEPYDGKILVGLMKSVYPLLKRRIE